MAESKKLKTKAGAKGIIFFFIILLVLGGVVYAIFFLPTNASQVKTALNSNYRTIQAESSLNKNIDEYKTFAHAHFLSKNEQANNTVINIEMTLSAFEVYDNYMSEILQLTTLKKYEKQDIKNITNNLNWADDKLDSLSNMLENKNESLTYMSGDENHYYYTEAKLVLESMLSKMEDVYKYYTRATEALAKLYRKNVVKGLYANEFAYRAIEGISYYTNYFYTNFNKASDNNYHDMAVNFTNFVKSYLSKDSGQPKVAKYQTNYYYLNKDFLDLEFFLNEVKSFTLKDLVLHEFNVDLSIYNAEQKESIEFAKSFLKGDAI